MTTPGDSGPPLGAPRHFRRQGRAGTQVVARYAWPGGVSGSAVVRNLGLGGAFVEVDGELGAALTLAFDAAGGGVVKVPAEVAWVARTDGELPAGVGVRFLALDDAAAEALAALCTALPPVIEHDGDEPDVDV